MTDTEKRLAQQVELREADDGAKTLVGYAAVFNSPTDIGGYFTEQIAPGAFAETITHFALYDAASSGNYLGGGALSVAKPVLNGDTASFPASSLTISLD